jgi:hypothetical protein
VTGTTGGADLASLLDQLEGRLRRWGAPVLDAFRPGASAEQVREVLGGEGLGSPRDLVAWWGWHDGAEGPVAPDGPGVFERPETVLVDSWHVLSLADAVRIRRWIRDDYARVGAPDVVPFSWIPVLNFAGAPFLAADSGSAGDSAVYVVDGAAALPERDPQPHFGSLAELVAVLIQVFDEGVVRPDPEDPRVPSLSGAPTTDAVRRLTRW